MRQIFNFDHILINCPNDLCLFIDFTQNIYRFYCIYKILSSVGNTYVHPAVFSSMDIASIIHHMNQTAKSAESAWPCWAPVLPFGGATLSPSQAPLLSGWLVCFPSS